MPQMMPLNWIFMFTQLTTIIIITTVLLFFLTTPTSPSQQTKPYPTQHSWKW